MPKKIDLTNQHIGEWTVLREATKEEKNYRPGAYWLCQCSCGTQRILSGQVLRLGQSKSCGCKTSQLFSEVHKDKNCIDITGQRFGRLTVLYRDKEIEKQYKGSNTYWKCQCDCGNTVSVVKHALTTGTTQSCGCYQKELARKNLSKISSFHFIDETNNRYGKLTVLYKTTPHPTREGARWHCRCDCGNEIDVMGIDLRSGAVSSCGCLSSSRGELLIENLLNKNHILYAREAVIEINKTTYRFDFAIFANNTIQYYIEFDGKQHFEPVEHFGGQEYLNYIQHRDKIKNDWCKEQNIALIRIPYTHLKDLCIEDLLLETSKFII